jgi:hypothetical protein
MSTSSSTVLDMTEQEQGQGEQDAAIALTEDRWQITGGGILTVHPAEEWVEQDRSTLSHGMMGRGRRSRSRSERRHRRSPSSDAEATTNRNASNRTRQIVGRRLAAH